MGDDSDAKLSQQMYQLANARAMLERYTAKIETFVNRERELKEMIRSLEESSSRETERLRLSMQDELDAKDKTIATLTFSYRAEKLKVQAAEKLKDSAHHKYEEGKKELEDEHEHCAKLQKSIDTYKGEIKRLGLLVDGKETDRSYAEQELEDAKTRCDAALRELAEVKAKLENCVAARSKLEKEKKYLEIDLNAAKDQQEFLTKSLEDVQNKAAEASTLATDEAKEISALKTKVAALEAQLGSKGSEVEEFRTQVQRLKSALSDADEIQEKMRRQGQQDAADAETTIRELKSQLADLQSDLRRATADAESLRRALESTQDDLKAAQRRLGEVEEEEHQLEDKARKLENQSAMEGSKAEQLQRRLSEVEADLEQRTREVQAARRQAADAQAASEACRAELAACKAKNDELSSALVEARADAASLKTRVASLEKDLARMRSEAESRSAKDGAELASANGTIAQLQSECERLMQELAGAREATQRSEQEVTEKTHTFKMETVALKDNLSREEKHFKDATGILLPITSAMKIGSLPQLQSAVTKAKAVIAGGTDFGTLTEIVEAVVNDGAERLEEWQECLETLIDAVAGVVAAEPGFMLYHECSRLLACLKEATSTKLDVAISDPSLFEQVTSAIRKWANLAFDGLNRVQAEIVDRVLRCRHFGKFDFVDLDQVLNMVNKADDADNAFFLDRAMILVKSHQVREYRSILGHLEVLLYFLKFLTREDLTLCYQRFQELNTQVVHSKFVTGAKATYRPGSELVKLAGLDLLDSQAVDQVLSQMKQPRSPQLMAGMQEIILKWVEIMRTKFDVLVLPHHTQVVCMIICLQYIMARLKGVETDVGALICQVSTGEGKSAVLAMLAVFCAKIERKKVHVVIDDEELLLRDFDTFKSLFDSFGLKANVCVTPERLQTDGPTHPHMVVRVDPDADIVYCDAAKLQSHYARIAKNGNANFEAEYSQRVLLLDEVDSLVIDNSPNVPFVYKNDELSRFATQVAARFTAMGSVDGMARTPSEVRVVQVMQRAWALGMKMVPGQDFLQGAMYNLHVKIENGKADPLAWSLPLECRNFADNRASTIEFREKLFIMSRANVYRKYGALVGLSGSVGNAAEQEYLTRVYRAQVVKVPVFLSTCTGAAYFEAEQREVHVCDNEPKQLAKVSEHAFENRLKVPVLIIAGSRKEASRLVRELRHIAESKQLNPQDVVRDLTRSLYETNPEQFKENLFKVGQSVARGPEQPFRVSVTDSTGGRGVDYRVTNPQADKHGGLLLIITEVPRVQRDWVQYLGRTGRQDNHGQWSVVLNRGDYAEDEEKHGQRLEASTAVDTILRWGNASSEQKISGLRQEYHRGTRMNEICEYVWQHDLIQQAKDREVLVQLCNNYSNMSISQINQCAAKITGLNPQQVRTVAEEVGSAPRMVRANTLSQVTKSWAGQPRSVLLVVDRSSSMMSQDATLRGTRRSRFDVCRESIMDIFLHHVDDQDSMGLYTFETDVKEVFPLTEKGSQRAKIEEMIKGMPGPSGLTKFYDAVLTGINQLKDRAGPKYLIALTDGDDNMSRSQPQGQLVTEAVRAAIPDFNLIVITVGSDVKPLMIEGIKCWCSIVKSTGNIGSYIGAANPAGLGDAFAAVAEMITADEGHIED